MPFTCKCMVQSVKYMAMILHAKKRQLIATALHVLANSPLSIICTPLSHTALILGSWLAISVCKMKTNRMIELIQMNVACRQSHKNILVKYQNGLIKSKQSYSHKQLKFTVIFFFPVLTINAWCFFDKFWAPVKSRPVLVDEAIGSFSLIHASSSSTSWRNLLSLSAS